MARNARNNSGMNPLPSLIRAASWDAGNRSMQDAGRKVWSRKDYNAAAAAQNNFVRTCYGLPTDKDERLCFIRFSIADRLQQTGHFTLASDFDEILGMIEDIFSQPVAA
jgi:hypothetical protein